MQADKDERRRSSSIIFISNFILQADTGVKSQWLHLDKKIQECIVLIVACELTKREELILNFDMLLHITSRY